MTRDAHAHDFLLIQAFSKILNNPLKDRPAPHILNPGSNIFKVPQDISAIFHFSISLTDFFIESKEGIGSSVYRRAQRPRSFKQGNEPTNFLRYFLYFCKDCPGQAAYLGSFVSRLFSLNAVPKTTRR